MENLETGKDKIKIICDVLKKETLEPAQKEAQEILRVAEKESHKIIQQAESKAEEIFKASKIKLEKEKALFEASMVQASQQGIEALKQQIENALFNQAIGEWIERNTATADLGARLVSALVNAIEKEGVSADFSALIPAEIPADQVNALLAREIMDKLREKSVVIGGFHGGVQLKLHDKQLTLDLSDQALKELIAQYIRKDFRELLFQS